MSERTDLELIPVRWAGLSNLLSLFGLGLLVWGASTEIVHRTGGGSAIAFVLLAVAAVSWVVALVVRRDDTLVAGLGIGVMALAGGALVAFAPTAIVFPAVAVFSAIVRWRIQTGASIAAAGWLAAVVAELAVGRSLGVVLGCLAAILGGALVGIARKQAVQQSEQAARIEVETVKAEVERERAELLTERNHLAREIHDVLAHTLAALSLQLEAFATVVESEPATSETIREQLDRTRRLVHEGLQEASGAVRALREDATPLDQQVRGLCAQHGAELTVSGDLGALPPGTVVGLYRVTQEALTNVMKHATGAPTSVSLIYEVEVVSVIIENQCLPSGSPELRASGGGYGLQGMNERLALLGGSLEVGPTANGWRVAASIPRAQRLEHESTAG